MSKADKDITVRARKAVDVLWNACKSRGRCWGRKRKGGNCFQGTNIVIIEDTEVVILSHGCGKSIRIHEFQRANLKTDLGEKVRRLLLDAEVAIQLQRGR